MDAERIKAEQEETGVTADKRKRKKGGIEPLELEAFRNRVKAGDRLMCYKTRRKGDVEEMALAEMRVVKSYPFIVLLVYKGACGNYFKTSMTWAEAVILNRMPQEELTAEVVKMQQERGLPYYISPERVRKGPEMDTRQRAALIVRMREAGKSYVEIAKAVGLHSTSVRVIYRKETEAE